MGVLKEGIPYLLALGCMVPWMSSRDACTKQIQRLPKHELVMKWILEIVVFSWGGMEYKSESCHLPCTILSAHSTHISSVVIGNDHGSGIELYFREDIQVENIVLAYDSTALLVEFGSCLGLWLGLSVVGMLDIIGLAAVKIKRFMKNLYQHMVANRGY